MKEALAEYWKYGMYSTVVTMSIIVANILTSEFFTCPVNIKLGHNATVKYGTPKGTLYF